MSQTSFTRDTSLLKLFWIVLAVPMVALATQPTRNWPMFGQNARNTASDISGINANQVKNLAPAWVATLGGSISARAAVVDGVVYVPDWGGNIWALDAATGKPIWHHQLSDYGPPNAKLAPGTVSRTSPAVVNGVVYIGTLFNSKACHTDSSGNQLCSTGWLLAINASDGTLDWMMQPEPTTVSNPFPAITSSPTVVNGVLYVGMDSNEEFAAANNNYHCCSQRGSVDAIDVSTHQRLWHTYTVPEGYSGGGVWGSNPVVDLARGLVYVGTGNNYAPPSTAAYANCMSTPGNTEANCLATDDYADSVLALRISDGSVKWHDRLMNWQGFTPGSDDWNTACIFGHANCPQEPGPDFDFGSAPNEITYTSGNVTKTIIGIGQKSGIYYALDPDTGTKLWATKVGPGSGLGGIQWGSASDGTRIYVAISDFNGIPYKCGQAGCIVALDPANNGTILWETPDPNGAVDMGPLTVSDGVVYASSMAGKAGQPTMFALDANNYGQILWKFDAGSSVIAGASIADGRIYWGSGYSHIAVPGFTGNDKFYAFTVNGK